LHWGWQGGYVFLALEGAWRQTNDAVTGFSYHVATDARLMKVELPVSFEATDSLEMPMILDVAKIFSHKNVFKISEATASTHSRTEDVTAATLSENIEQSFSIGKVVPLTSEPAPVAAGKIEIAAGATM